MGPIFDEQKLGWHIGENMRWLADQHILDRYMPCGMLPGQFLKLCADRLENCSAETERDAVSAWLRSFGDVEFKYAADAISRGDHLRQETK